MVQIGISSLAIYPHESVLKNFFYEYLGLPNQPRPFGGRETELTFLRAWLRDPSQPGKLVLTAPAGRGKSALLVHWLQEILEDNWTVVFVPVSIRFGTAAERPFFPILAALLSAKHGVMLPPDKSDDAAYCRALAQELLNEPLPDNRPMVLIIDGLDEAVGWTFGAGFFPYNHPPGVKIVVSAREQAGDDGPQGWIGRLNWDSFPGLAEGFSLDVLTREGIRDVLVRMGGPLANIDAGSEMLDELEHLTEGDPLLVRLYVEDLWTLRTRVPELRPEHLKGLAKGYKGYFDKWLQDQRQLWPGRSPVDEKAKRLVLTILACTKGPLSRRDIRQVLCRHMPAFEGSIHEAIEPFQRFIVGEGSSGRGYVFSHPKLAEYFRSGEFVEPEEVSGVTSAILGWGRETVRALAEGKVDAGSVSPYLVQFYSAHLKENAPDELTTLVSDGWRRAWEHCEGGHSGFATDVRRAWACLSVRTRADIKGSGQSPLVADELRCALICASVNTVSTGLTPPLLPLVARKEGWTMARMLAEARAIAIPQARAAALAALADGLSGDELGVVVIDALAAVRSIQDPYWRAGTLSWLMRVLGLQATMPEVKQIFEGIDEPGQRAAANALVAHVRAGGTLSDLATTPDAADSGFLDPRGLAAQLAAFSPDTNEASTLRRRYLEDTLGDERTLLAQAVSIADPHTRSLVLASLSEELGGDARAAARAQAVIAARSIGDRPTAAALRSDLLRLLARRGHRDEALRLALADDDALSRTATLVALAPQLPDDVVVRVLHAAIRDFGSIPAGSGGVALAGDLAAWLTAAGDVGGVRTIAAAAGDRVQRWRVLARAALGSTAAEDLLWAELDTLKGDVWPAAVAESAEVLAAPHCREALVRTARSEEAADRDLVLAAIAARLAVLGAGNEARTLLTSIRDDAWYGLAAANIATSFAAQGSARVALEIASAVRQLAWRIRATAPTLALLGPADRTAVLDELVALAEATGDLQSSGHLRTLVLPMVDGTTRDRIAADVIALVPQVSDGAALACDLAVALARAGCHDEALASATGIDEDQQRAEALAGIAPLLDGRPDSATRIIQTARTLTSTEARLAILTGLAGPMEAAPALARYEVWDEVLKLLASSTRRQIADYRAWIGAALGDLATDDGIKTALVACEEVFRWWP